MADVHFGLKDKVALITGGSRGIGKEIAVHMAKEGARVIVCGRKQTNLDAAKENFSQYDLDITTWPVHVAKSDQVAALMKMIGEQFGVLDILVNNVGMNIFTPHCVGCGRITFR